MIVLRALLADGTPLRQSKKRGMNSPGSIGQLRHTKISFLTTHYSDGTYAVS